MCLSSNAAIADFVHAYGDERVDGRWCYNVGMMSFRAHYDGSVFVPDEPVDLPVHCPVDVTASSLLEPEDGQGIGEIPPLMRLVRAIEELPPIMDLPTDAAAQHDHYLYGTPKR